MRVNTTEQLFPNETIYKQPVEISDALLSAVDTLPTEKLGATPTEQEASKTTIKNWVTTLWYGIEFVLQRQNLQQTDREQFKSQIASDLLKFITHKDHGILHSYFVYKGILHLAVKNNNPITPGSTEDKQAQLMALLHDIAQTITFALDNTKFRTRYSHQKNDHAQIIGDLGRIFGRSLGFNRTQMLELTFGLTHHDDSYYNIYHHETFNRMSKLLHDSDKIFGTSLSTDISELTIGMLERNYQANRGENGSYVFREEIPKSTRNLIMYGDRCMSDAISLVRKEFNIEMYTQAGQEIAEQRRQIALNSAQKVYGKFFDLTNNFISQHILEYIQGNRPNMKLTIVGMEQEESELPQPISTISDFTEEVEKLYQTPIHLQNEHKFLNRYGKNHARGLKIHVVDTTQSFGDQHTIDLYLDPSIARYCLKQNGREEFLEKVNLAFQNGVH